MKRGAGKAKGGAFEREVCKLLSLWITNGKNGTCLWRSAMSGGRATVGTKRKVGVATMTKGWEKRYAHVSGDLCAVHPDGNEFIKRFYCECKSYKSLDPAAFLFKQGGKLADFWIETKAKARWNGKEPMLIFKQNLMPICIAFDSGGWMTLALMTDTKGMGFPRNVTIHELDMHILGFAEFLKLKVKK